MFLPALGYRFGIYFIFFSFYRVIILILRVILKIYSLNTLLRKNINILFEFFTKKNKTSALDFSDVGVDIHSHLIPGIDDGAKTIEDSLILIKKIQELGFKEIITTPHIYSDYYPNTSAIILNGLEKVRAALKENNIDIPLKAASEYYLDEHFETLLNANDILTLDGKHILVEMSFFGAPPQLFQYLFKIQTKGYKPVLAHPERYSFYEGDLKKYEALKEAGCLFQINALSISGYYGPIVQRDAQKLLKAGMIDLIGTDIHHERHAEMLKKSLNSAEMQKLLSNIKINNSLFSVN